ncbi:DNA polymerase alpha/epsilon subunit B-domain-containing protein [Coniochaeta sp. 2T2.1]|nr:DNA polymerase alpha/epsilon subunit B-domain-containing protein [Coniochaeta sp. 2T2.1]
MIVIQSPRKKGQKTPQQSPEKNGDLPTRRTKPPVAPFFAPKNLAAQQLPDSSIPSSSPFGTPAVPLRPFTVAPAKAAILPILLPPATLRPLAFRTFTKKHSLTLTSTALQELATFIGRHCGSGWREEGLAEKVLEEVAKSWKNRNGGVIVEGNSPELKDILKNLEGNMSGGKIISGGRGLMRQNSLMLEPMQDSDYSKTRLGLRPSAALMRDDSQTSIGMSGLEVEDEPEDEELSDPRRWLKVIDAFSQPQYTYNIKTKHFERQASKPSLLPPAAHKTTLFRNRYNVIHQRLLRQDSFQTSAVHEARAAAISRSSTSSSLQQSHKITAIANLLGRHGSYRMLLGMLVILPEGQLAISDLTGTIALDLSQAVAIPADSAWFCPGMIVLVDGVYEEEEETLGKGLSGSSGVGGTIGGRFQGFFIGQPPCETRHTTLGIGGDAEHSAGGGFGWIDFLGVGSERAVGSKMRRLEKRLLTRQLHLSSSNNPEEDVPAASGRARMVILGELNLDNPRSLQVLRKILTLYAAEPEGATPMSFVITGNFSSRAVMASRGGSHGSIEYKEYFDALASTLADFPALLTTATFVFVPGDNDGWVSAFSGGAAVPLPRKAVPDLFTSRVRRVFAAANAEAGLTTGNEEREGGRKGGEAVWTSNPTRLSLFGTLGEVVVFRDDMSSRLRRTAVRLKPSEKPTAEEQPAPEEVEMSGATPPPADEDVMDVDTAPAPSSPPVAPNPPPPAAADNNTVPHDVKSARKLVKTILDQGYLTPFRQAIRPVHWDYGSAMHLYPLPTAMVLVDAETSPFVVRYEGCLVMNPGAVVVSGRRGVGRWVEYEFGTGGGVGGGGSARVRECLV